MAAAQFSSRFVKRYSQQTQEAVGEVTGSLGEILGAVQAVKLAGKEQHVVAAFQRVGEKRRRALLRMTLVMETISAFSWNTTAFATAGVLLGAVLTGQVNTMTAGDFGLFATYAGSMGFLVGFFGELLGRSKQSVVSAQRMVDVLHGAAPDALAEHHPVDAETATALEQSVVSGGPLRTLRVSGLTYIHPGSEAGITDATFALQHGSLTVITGRVGSGKTTLLRALLGLLPGQGDVTWNERPIENRDVFFQPPNSAYVPQVPRLFSDTLRDNVVMGAPVDGADADIAAAIRAAVFERDVADFELGLDTLVGVRGAKVSGGSCSAPPLHAHLSANRNCSWSMISPARSMLKPSRCSGNACLKRLASARCWQCRIAGPRSTAPITSSCSKTAASSIRARWRHCWNAARRCATFTIRQTWCPPPTIFPFLTPSN